jgi:membrane-bound lytic murein transglycosylase F
MRGTRPGQLGLYALALVLVPILVAARQLVERVDDERWTNAYDHHFRKYAKHYFGPGFDWRWFKSQAIAESTLNPKAKSQMGALGLMQILPSTFAEIKEANPHFRSVSEPKWNIAAGIYYDRILYRRWAKTIDGRERLHFAFASYNAGFGNVRKAYRKAKAKHGEVGNWKQVAAFAPGQTRHYVRRIRRLMGRTES